jgi:hypothetical protein
MIAMVATVMNVPGPITKADLAPTQNKPCAIANSSTRIAPEHGLNPAATIAVNPRLHPSAPPSCSGHGA